MARSSTLHSRRFWLLLLISVAGIGLFVWQ